MSRVACRVGQTTYPSDTRRGLANRPWRLHEPKMVNRAGWHRMIGPESWWPDAGLLLLRLWFGLGLAFAHGWPKLVKLDAFVAGVAKRGFPIPEVLGPLAMASELLGGLLMALGFLTRPATAAVLFTMLTAAFKVHAADPFAKKELALAYAFAALVVLIAGPGRYSLDSRLFRRRV